MAGRDENTDRAARLAAQLRANLRRRKAQGRARRVATPASDEPADNHGACPDDDRRGDED